MKLFRNLVRAVGIAAAACSAIAQDSTSQPIRVILPFGPGSGTDNIARPLFDALSRELNQSFTINNRPAPAALWLQKRPRAPRQMGERCSSPPIRCFRSTRVCSRNCRMTR
jgi:hypothetical protein